MKQQGDELILDSAGFLTAPQGAHSAGTEAAARGLGWERGHLEEVEGHH